MKEELNKKKAAIPLPSQDLQKEIRALTDQLIFFKAELARKDDTILIFGEELKRFNEFLRSSQDDVEKMKDKRAKTTPYPRHRR